VGARRRGPHGEGTSNGWQRFWDKGGWWRRFLLAIAYLVVFNLISLTTSTRFAGFINAENPTGSASSVFFALVVPILRRQLCCVRSCGLSWTKHRRLPEIWGGSVVAASPSRRLGTHSRRGSNRGGGAPAAKVGRTRQDNERMKPDAVTSGRYVPAPTAGSRRATRRRASRSASRTRSRQCASRQR